MTRDVTAGPPDERPWRSLGPTRSAWLGWSPGLEFAWVFASGLEADIAAELELTAIHSRAGGLVDEPLPPGTRYFILTTHDRDAYQAADIWAARRRAASDAVHVRDWSEYLEDADVDPRAYDLARLIADVGAAEAAQVVWDLPLRGTEAADALVGQERELSRAKSFLETSLVDVERDPGAAFTDAFLEAAARLQLDDAPAFERLYADLRGLVDLRRWPSACREAVSHLAISRRERPVEQAKQAGRTVQNFTTTFELADNGRTKAVYHHVDLNTAIEQVHQATSGWPRIVRGQLFVPGPDYGAFSGSTPIHRIETTADLSAWLQRHCEVSWRDGQVRKGGDQVRSVNYGELFAGLQQAAPSSYDRVESLPHHPPADRIHYTCPTPEGDGEALDTFLDLFNPETDADRRLIQALLVTPGWGGGFGRRPAFVVMSDHGRGVGKTSTIDAISRVWGGYLAMAQDEDWGQFVSRLLTPEADSKRLVFIDNLKGRFNSSALESAVTLPTISGRQLYVGNATTPNSFTWCISANTPELSTDLSDRSVPIKIGPRQHDIDFVGQVIAFLEERHEALVGDIIAFLQDSPRCELEVTTRFQTWERAILSKFEDGNELVELIRSRRGAVDAEADDAADALAVIHRLLRDGGYPDPDRAHTIIPTSAMVDAFRRHWMEKSLSTVRFWSKMKPLLIQPAFDGQASKQDGGRFGRGLQWCGVDVPTDSPVGAWDADEHPYA